MNDIYPEQLQNILKNQVYYHYVLFGNNSFLLTDTQNIIFEYIKYFHEYERYDVSIDSKSISEKIFKNFQTENLFCQKKKIFFVNIAKEKFNNYILKKLFSSISLSQDLSLIICIHKSIFISKKHFHFSNNLKKYILFIDCNTPQYSRLILWASKRAEKMQITLNQEACNLLYSRYEYDLNGLNQILYQLSILYPQKNINTIHIKNLLGNATLHADLSDLLEPILKGNIKHANNVLKTLKTENTFKPLTILHTIQNIIFLLILLKRQLLLHDNISLTFLFNKYKIQKIYYLSFIEALKRLTLRQLYQIKTFLLQIEITINQEHEKNIWHNFKLFIWLLCKK